MWLTRDFARRYLTSHELDSASTYVCPNEECFVAAGFYFVEVPICDGIRDATWLTPVDLHGVFIGEEEVLGKVFDGRGYRSWCTKENVAWHKWERGEGSGDYVKRGGVTEEEERGLAFVVKFGGERGAVWRERVGRGKELGVLLRGMAAVGRGAEERGNGDDDYLDCVD